MKIHLIDIGGMGVSALARYYLNQGWEVSGTEDLNPLSELLHELKKEGVKIKIGSKKNNIDSDTDLVIYGQRVPRGNPILLEARKRRIPVITYPQALGRLTEEFMTIALAGTHGKSTTTALTALSLIEAEMDPTVIVGTKVPQLGGKNFRKGKSKYLVIEADEYKDAFLNYSPTAALITNIDKEHLDYFKNLNHIKRSFLKFINHLWLSDSHRWRSSRVLVLNKDNTPLLSMKNEPHFAKATRGKEIIWYSLKEKNLAQKIKKHLKIPGEHNLSNALGVYKLGRALGVKEKDIFKAFSKYRGSWRRMEYRGMMKFRESIPNTLREYSRINSSLIREINIPVYDDYAHHPTEIKATLSAFKEKFPKAKIICVFQPHQAERLRKLFKEFTTAFDETDTLILLDIFKVHGREQVGNRKPSFAKASAGRQEIGSRQLAEAIRKRKSAPVTIIYLPKSNLLRNSINQILGFGIWDLGFPPPQAVVVMMGAGDIVDLTDRLIREERIRK